MFFRRLPSLMAFQMACMLGAQTAAEASTAPPLISLSFDNAEIEGVARTLSEISRHNIVVDPRVKGTLSLNTDHPVRPEQAWQQFLSALRLQGYTVVEAAGLYKIVPEAEGKLQSTTVAAGTNKAQGDRIVTEIFRLNYENAGSLVPVLRPLITANNVINVNAGNNSLVITDYASNLDRLRTIVAAMDTPSATDVEVIPLQYTTATEVAATVRRLSVVSATPSESSSSNAGTTGNAGAQGAQGAAVTAATPQAVTTGSGVASLSIVADGQTNSLLVRAANRAQLAAVRSLVAQLDRARDNVNVRVVYLRNTDAVRMAQVLRAAFPSETASAGTGTASTTAAGISPTSSSGIASVATSSTGKTSAQTTPSVTAAAQPTTGGGIQADPASNSLVITAPEPRFREMRQIIDQLDARRAQLYVESLVVEVDASRSVDLGLQWASLPDIASTTALTLGTVAKALETISGTNILSTANVVTMDNEEARIVVGQNVPFITGSYTSSTNSNPFQTVDRKDVGITLRIRPQIGENGNIRMTIYQESSSVASTSSTLGPTTNQRSIDSSVTVDDGKIIVLGGLIEDKYTDEANNVPWVSEIPLLGAVFRSISRSRKKTNLLVFLRPVVMRDAAASEALSLDRYDYIGARQRELPAELGRPARAEAAGALLEQIGRPAVPPVNSTARQNP